MSLKLDDFLTKKKEPVQILDLSKGSANNYEELKKMMEKVPEYKIKMDKIKPEEVKTFEKKCSLKIWNEESEKNATNGTGFAYANPIPCDMRSLRLEDLCSVNIQWKMLTSLRPKSKSDEDYFSKLVEFGKLQLRARHSERNNNLSRHVRKSKNKAGISQVKIISCGECGEEFCSSEICRLFAYDSYERCAQATLNEIQMAHDQQPNNVASTNVKKTKQRRSVRGTRPKKPNKRGREHRSSIRADRPTTSNTCKDESAVKIKTIRRPRPPTRTWNKKS